MAGYIGSKSSVVLNAGATGAQGTLADTAVQPADLATVASTGSYNDLSGLPTLGTAASTASTDYATAAQGTLADTAVQPADNISTLTNDAGYLTVAPAPFVPLAVTGTTPSLDIGSYNFFDNGTLSGDTTVSFASAPTEARWTYSFKAGLLSAYDLGSASYVQSLGVTTQESNPYDVFFKPDGLRMYVVGSIGDDINEYSLNTAWDVSTASYVQNFSVAAEDLFPLGLFFKPDGTKMFITGNDDDVYEYSLSAAWNISTASYVQLFDVSAQDSLPIGLFFKPDGTSMYVVGNAGQDVNEYSLSTAWNISTASFVQLFSLAAEDILPRGLFFKPDGTKMYVVGTVGDAVYEYDTGALATMTLPASVQNTPQRGFDGEARVTYDFFTLDGGTNVYLIGEEVT